MATKKKVYKNVEKWFFWTQVVFIAEPWPGSLWSSIGGGMIIANPIYLQMQSFLLP